MARKTKSRCGVNSPASLGLEPEMSKVLGYGAAPRRWLLRPPALAAILLAAACQVQLISQYDEQTDVAATQFHKQIEGFLLQMEALSESDMPEAVAGRSYAANQEFYRELDVALSSMALRARSIPQNDLTIQQVELLEQSVESLKQLHAEAGERGLRRAVVLPLRAGINAQLGSIIRLELAKKRGESE